MRGLSRGVAMTLAVALGALVWPLVSSGQGAVPLRFRAAVDYDAAGVVPAGLALGDLNGDGDADLVVAGRYQKGGGDEGRIAVLLGDKAARFSGAANFPAGTRPISLTVADVAPGAALDVAVGDAGAGTDTASDNDAVAVLANQAGDAGASGDATTGFAAPAPYGSGGALPAAVVAADLNGDELADLVVANRLSGTVTILAQKISKTADHRFELARRLEPGGQPCGLAVGDLDGKGLNGNGKADVAVTNAGDGTVSLYSGEANFAEPATYRVGDLVGVRRPCAVAATDVNADGRRDLVTADSVSGTVAVLAAGQDGTFTVSTEAPQTGTAGVTALAVGDFNGDKDPDLAVADGDHDTVSVVPGEAGASFGKAVPVGFGTEPAGAGAVGATGLVVGDLDSDGDADLAVARAAPGSDRPALAVLVNVAVPAAVADRYMMKEDAPDGLSVPDVREDGILGNDEPDAVLKPKVVKAPVNGTLNFGDKGGFGYKPNPDFNGTDTFDYTVTDEAGVTSAPATVEIMVEAVNDDPVAMADGTPDKVAVDEDSSIDVPVTKNDRDVDGDPIKVVAAEADDGHTVKCGPQSCKFTPRPNFHGPAHFDYSIADGQGGVAPAGVDLNVTPQPDAPVARPDADIVPEDTIGGRTVEVLANDTDADAGDVDFQPLEVNGFTQPKNGIVNCAGSSCTYIPTPNFSGPDSFTYTVTDGTGRTSTATVTMTVSAQDEPPVAVEDRYPDAREDKTLVVGPTKGVLANDKDPDGDALTVLPVAGTTRGELILAEDGSFTYTPSDDFSGTDTFTYQAFDGEAPSEVATVTITVAAVNDPPAAAPDSVTTVVGKPVTFTIAGISDVDDDELEIAVTTPPVHGRVTCAEAPKNATAGALPMFACTYRPRPHYVGDDPFTYTVTDAHGGAASAPVAVTVFPAGPRGYWLLGAEGSLYSFGSAPDFGNPPPSLDGAAAVDLEPSPSGNGYWVLDDDGRVHPFGDAAAFGSVDPFTLGTGDEARALVLTASGQGYWVVTAAGRVFPFGDAKTLGDLTDRPPPAPVVGAAVTPNGEGYYLVGSDGEVYAFGNAALAGSLAGQARNAPAMSIAADPDGTGYWLAAADGGVFAFDAPYHGSMGSVPLNGPVRGIRAYGTGYMLVAEDGGVFVFSDRPFHGSLGGAPPARPVTGGVIF